MNLPPYESVGWMLAAEEAYLPRVDVPSPPGMSRNTVHTVTVGGELLMRWYYHDTDVTFRWRLFFSSELSNKLRKDLP